MSRDLGGLGALWDPEELWSTFKTTVLDVTGQCLGTHRRAKKNFVSQGTLDTIAQRARLNDRAEAENYTCTKGGQGGLCVRNL